MDADLLTYSDLAELMGLAPETVRWYSTQQPHRLPPRVKWGKKPLWKRSVVLAWIAKRDGSDTTPPPKAVPLERAPRKTAVGRPRRPSL